MKNLLYLIAFMFIFASCSKDEEVQPTEPATVKTFPTAHYCHKEPLTPNRLYYILDGQKDSTQMFVETGLLVNFPTDPGEDLIRAAFNSYMYSYSEYVHILIRYNNGAGTYHFTSADTTEIFVGLYLNGATVQTQPYDLTITIYELTYYTINLFMNGYVYDADGTVYHVKAKLIIE